MLQYFGLLDTILGLIIVYIALLLPIATWVMVDFFNNVPREIDEMAMLDGCHPIEVFFRVILPLAAPILAVVALITFVFTINEFLVGSAVLGQGDADRFPLSVGMFRFIDDQGQQWGQFTAGSVLAGTPVVVLFAFLQRYIVSGLTTGAVKG
jgi:arabinogalactan oligomer/maltooligosaccharide transport system permease protein